jgi:MEMO1 family protein
LPAIRPAAVAGSFYPAAAAELQREIGELLGGAETAAVAPVPKALIAPHAGYIYSGPIAAAGYSRLAPARERITRVVLLGPSHFVGFHGMAAGSAEGWQTPLGTVPIDRPVVDRLIEARLIGVLDAAHAREHSLEVQLPFLQVALSEFVLVPIVAGDASPEAVAALLDAAWAGPETLIVVSTDLSHYLDYRSCQETDRQTADAIERLDSTALGPDSACGRVPVLRPALRRKASRDEHRQARPAQFRRHRRPARPGGRLRQLGAVRVCGSAACRPAARGRVRTKNTCSPLLDPGRERRPE